MNYQILSDPEFLGEGTEVQNFHYPDRVLNRGDRDNEGRKDAIEALVNLYVSWVLNEIILAVNIWSSDLSKLTGNVFLAQRVPGINATNALCEKRGPDVKEVPRAVGMDSGMGP